MPFQRSTMTFDDVPMPTRDATGRGLDQARDRLREQRRAARVDGDDGLAEPQRRRPRRREREDGERVVRRRLRSTRCR